MKRALFSVYKKEGIDRFAKFLADKGYEIISSGGTYKYLKDKGVPVTEVSDATGFPEVLGGRVKTLHPVIHAGILAVRGDPSHMKDLADRKVEPIDFVVCSLYPFEETVAQGAPLPEVIEQIDIGGVTLIRAAAKNFKDVTVIVDTDDFETVINEVSLHGATEPMTRQNLARKAFNHTAFYDGLIANYFNRMGTELFPKETSIPLKKLDDLRYGENPHQLAAVYKSYVDKNASILNAEILWGKQLSYNNVLDADACLDIVREFAGESRPFCVIVKHTNPCGASFGGNLLEAYVKALAGEPEAAFGGIVGFTRKVDQATAAKAIETFCEIVIAPDYDPDALETFKTKKNLRIVKLTSENFVKKGMNYRRVEGGMLAQEWDNVGMTVEDLRPVTKAKPTPEQDRDLKFAWRICKYVKSNAIVYVKDEQVIGVGAGQMARVDSARIGVDKARRFGFDPKGAVMASDAFFPFRDSVDAAAEVGVSAIIQPGGSVRDEDSIAAANEHGIAMVFTGVRHFRH